MTSTDIEMQVAKYFNYCTNIIVPNVSWGIYGLRYEADVVVLRPSGFAVEIEIKISKADIKRDLQKTHRHGSKLFRELWFAVPDILAQDQNIPEYAGVLAVTAKGDSFEIHKVRLPKINKSAILWPETSRNKLLHLGAMRIWGLKSNLMAQKLRHQGRHGRKNSSVV